MRNSQPLVEQLRAWGNAQVNRFALSRAERTVHVLGKVRDSAPMTKERADRELVGRDGTERRTFMAERSGVAGMAILPLWAVDPVRSSNDADRPHDNPEIAFDMGIPEELRWVERGLAEMERQYPLRALIARTEYTVAASQAVKARMVAEKYGGSLSVWQYRRELERAVEWMKMRNEGWA